MAVGGEGVCDWKLRHDVRLMQGTIDLRSLMRLHGEERGRRYRGPCSCSFNTM